VYRYCGLPIESELRLDDLPPARGSARLRIVLVGGPPPPPPPRWDHDWLLPDGRVSVSVVREDATYRLRFPRLAEFTIAPERERIICRPVPRTPAPLLRHLLLDQVLPRWLSLGERFLLHAGAVRSASGIVAFIGTSGRGKSTLCAAFADAGAALLGDDCLALMFDAKAGLVRAEPTYRGVRLSPDTLARLRPAEARTARKTGAGKLRLRGATSDPAPAAPPAPLRRVYLLDEGPRIEIGAMSPHERVTALIANSFHLDVVDPQRAASIVERAVALSSRVGLRRLSYPRRFEALPRVISVVLGDLADAPPR